jgi:hypothetical protein
VLGAFFLNAGGSLGAAGQGAAGTLSLQVGASTSYDVVMPVRTALSGTPRLFVSAVVDDREGKDAGKGDGHGRLLATLWDCAPAGGCTELSSGHVEVKNHHAAGPELEDGKLKRVDGLIEAGHTLRLTLQRAEHGNAVSELLLQGGNSGSRLELTATPSPVAVAGLGLAALLLLLGLAGRPKQPQVLGGVDVAG